MRHWALAAALATAALAACRLFVETGDLDTEGSLSGRDASAGSDGAQEGSSQTDAGADVVRPPCAPNAPPQDDPRNCGACGHDCLGGTCVGGACQPFVIVPSLTEAEGVAVDGDTLFYADGTHLHARTISTGVDVELGRLDAPGPHLAVDGTYVYAGTGVGTQRIPRAGGAPETVIPCDGGCIGVAVHGGLLYSMRREGQISAQPADGGGPLQLLLTAGLGPEDLDVDDQSIFIADENGSNVLISAVGSGAAVDFAPVTDPVSVAIDGQTLWIASQGDGKILRAARGTGQTTVVASGQSFPTGICASSTVVYWGDRERVMALAK